MAKTKKKVNKKTMTKKMKVLLLSAMSVVVALSIVAAVVFGFKLHLYGKEYTITFNPKGGEVTPVTMVVEFGKEYSLPKATKDGEIFAYWKTSEQEKVAVKGRWKIDKDVTLYAVWKSEIIDEDWTPNY